MVSTAARTFKNGNVYDPGSDSWSPIAEHADRPLGHGRRRARTGCSSSRRRHRRLNTITNQGFAYDPSTDSWAAIPNAQFPRYRAGGGCGFYKVGGSSGGFSPTPESEKLSELDQCGATDVPWLSESPTEFDVPVGATVNVTVTLKATTDAGVTQPGTYTAQLAVNANMPQTIEPDRRHDERDAAQGLGEDRRHGDGQGLQREHRPAAAAPRSRPTARVFRSR